ncbi:MAG: hypothetical protein ABIT96_01080 [Ferruginibacter sp.]
MSIGNDRVLSGTNYFIFLRLALSALFPFASSVRAATGYGTAAGGTTPSHPAALRHYPFAQQASIRGYIMETCATTILKFFIRNY